MAQLAPPRRRAAAAPAAAEPDPHDVSERPFPPGDYPVVIVGSGPGGIQASYCLSRLGIAHAVISADPVPGGMFRRFPFFQRLLSWTKPYAPFARGTRGYEWYDWNSLLADEPQNRALMPLLMDSSSEFPSRPEMERNITEFARRTGVRVRHECLWQGTRRDGDRFVLETSDGDYRCQAAIFAVGLAQPYKPDTPGIEHAAHYAETRDPASYAGKRLFIIGKENSGCELASGLLHWAQRIVLASPRPAQLSINTHSLGGVRARYVQPIEDQVVGGGVLLLNASLHRIERTSEALQVHCMRSDGSGELVVEADEVIAATGFTAPLLDLPALGVSTFGRSRLPSQTPFWESATVPGIYFAGTIGQGSGGMKKYGIPSNSGAVHGARYNTKLMVRHLAETRFGVTPSRPVIQAADVVRHLLEEATVAPELWNQKSYLARWVSLDPSRGVVDEGVIPLAHFVDATSSTPAVAIAVETDDRGEIHPAVYVRAAGRAADETLLESHPMLDFRTAGNRHQLEVLLRPLLGSSVR